MRLLIIFFFPVIITAQNFDDVMSIDSYKQFSRVMIENGYNKYLGEYKLDDYHEYTLIENSNSKESKAFSNYEIQNEEIQIIFRVKKYEDVDIIFNSIFDNVKEKCQFIDVKEYFGAQYVFYNCERFGNKKYIFGFTNTTKDGIIYLKKL